VKDAAIFSAQLIPLPLRLFFRLRGRELDPVIIQSIQLGMGLVGFRTCGILFQKVLQRSYCSRAFGRLPVCSPLQGRNGTLSFLDMRASWLLL
jgi:hypothetical protein